MKILGLTGGMGMGKSTVASMLRRAGVAVFDADATVHALQAPGGAALLRIAQLVPQAVTAGRLDRAVLRQAVLAHPALLKKLEAIMHPLVRRARTEFLRRSRLQGAACVVLDIPLLFETGADRLCRRVAVVSAPPWVQRRRVAHRRNMPPPQARRLIACQMRDARRVQKADIVIRTGLSMKETERQVRRFIRSLRA
ncbi:dephospho-CoA kinase [Acetobacter fabarum]|uniref:dephospho-CoA kinase n=1 Tax=Acetobacter fabarum TaxID=483199 RepID=UPI0033B0C4D6